MKGYKYDLLNYLNKGELSINNSELLVFEKDSLLVKFSITDGFSETRDGIYKSDFNEYLKNTTLDVFSKSEIYFNVVLTANMTVFPIPGIFIRTDNEYTVSSTNGPKYPLEEMYKPFFKNQKEFDQHIKNIVKYN